MMTSVDLMLRLGLTQRQLSHLTYDDDDVFRVRDLGKHELLGRRFPDDVHHLVLHHS